MKYQTKLNVPNSLILVMDYSIGEVSLSLNDNLIAKDKSCLAIGTLSEYDGETEVILTDEENVISETDILAYEGEIHTPEKVISKELTKVSAKRITYLNY